MPIRVVPHSEEYKDAVHSFNLRMREGGSNWGFYVRPQPTWIPAEPGARAWREYHLAVEDDGTVRGGYALKPQQWQINGKQLTVTDWQGPFTEGAVNLRYSTLALRLLRDMLKKYPLLYSTGHGGDQEPVVQLIRTMGWPLHPMPFCFKVLRPFNFLRRNAYLRRTTRARVFLDALAFSGAGVAGLSSLQKLRGLRQPSRSNLRTSVVQEFGPWADTLWNANRNAYQCIAIRDSNMMNRILPQTGWPGGTRLVIEKSGKLIGWSVVHIKQMQGDARFGTLNTAQISDCFASPNDATEVLAATHDYLETRGVDLICSNQSHSAWVDGFYKLGYFVLEGRRIFAIAPELESRMEPMAKTLQGLHLTNMDGHGPHGFTESSDG